MKLRALRIVIVTLMLSIFIIGCTGELTEGEPEVQMSETEAEAAPEVESPTEETVVEEEPEPTVEPTQPSRFTILADDSLKEAVSALYSSYFTGEDPEFVEENADLIATGLIPTYEGQPSVEITFLPETVFIPQSDNEDVQDFLNFSISPDGQQVLIDLGALPATVTLTDQAGNQVEIQQPVRRVISAYGPATAIVYTVNAWDRMVSASYLGARDPQGAAAMSQIDPRFPDIVGDELFSQQEFNVEQAAMLEPDLIIGSSRSTWVDTINQLGIQVFLMEAETPQQLKDSIVLIGKLFGPHSEAQAQAWVAYYDQVVATVQEQVSGLSAEEKPRVLFTGTEPLRVASGDMYQTDIIEAAGGISVSSELGGYWNDINLEQVATWYPEILIVPPYGGATVEAITESEEWQILAAVQQGKVYRMPKLVVPWDTPAPDSVLGIVWMARQINGDQVDLSCQEESEYFYNTFYNYAISDEEIATLCALE